METINKRPTLPDLDEYELVLGGRRRSLQDAIQELLEPLERRQLDAEFASYYGTQPAGHAFRWGLALIDRYFGKRGQLGSMPHWRAKLTFRQALGE